MRFILYEKKMVDRSAARRKFERMFPEAGDGHSYLDHGDLDGHRRAQQRSQELHDSLNLKKTEESTLDELDGLIGFSKYDFTAGTHKFFTLERNNGEIVVYPNSQVKFIEQTTKEEVMKTFLSEPVESA